MATPKENAPFFIRINRVEKYVEDVVVFAPSRERAREIVQERYDNCEYDNCWGCPYDSDIEICGEDIERAKKEFSKDYVDLLVQHEYDRENAEKLKKMAEGKEVRHG